MRKYLLIAVFLIGVGTAVGYAQTSESDPILVIPGIGTSWNTDVLLDPTPTTSFENWTFTTNHYNQLIRSFEDAGLVEGEDFFIVFYDWRQRNDDSATNYLLPVIDEALAHSESGKVDIVAHSMGGLVARAYIHSDAYRGDVDQFIMLGTPNYGSGDVYTLWEGGNIPDNWVGSLQAFIRGYLWYTSVAAGLSDDDYDTIHTYVPSIQELLPTYDYLVDKDTGFEIDAGDMQEQNLFLQVINSGGAFELAERVEGGVAAVSGEDFATVGRIPVVPHTDADGKFWVDGKPDPVSPIPNDEDGDGTVLIASAFLEEDAPVPVYNDPLTPLQKFVKWFTPAAHAQFFLDQFTLPSKHNDLPTNAIGYIFDTFNLGTPSFAYTPEPEPEEVLSFWFASPVDVQITAPLGGIVTKTSSTIPGAVYESASDPLGFKMVVIPNPEPGAYSVELTGLAGGSYHMGIGGFTPAGDTIATVADDTVEGRTTTYSVAYSPTTPETIDISEPTVEDPPVDEPTAPELLDELIAVVQAHHDASVGREQKAYRALLVMLRVARFFLEHDRTHLAQGTLKVFDFEVKKLSNRGVIDQSVATDLLARSAAVQEALIP